MLYGTTIYILYKIGGKVVAVLHIYSARANFLLFCNHQDTDSESCEMEIDVAGPIFVQKKYQKCHEKTISIPPI